MQSPIAEATSSPRSTNVAATAETLETLETTKQVHTSASYWLKAASPSSLQHSAYRRSLILTHTARLRGVTAHINGRPGASSSACTSPSSSCLTHPQRSIPPQSAKHPSHCLHLRWHPEFRPSKSSGSSYRQRPRRTRTRAPWVWAAWVPPRRRREEWLLQRERL